MIAEYQLAGRQFRSLVISESAKSVVVWGPGKVCKTCSGYGRGLAPVYRNDPNDGRKRIQIGHKYVACEECNGHPIGKVHALKLNKVKNQVTLRRCGIASFDYTYIGAPMS